MRSMSKYARLILLGPAAFLCFGCGSQVTQTQSTPPGQASSPFGTTMSFDEEFNETSLNTTVWNYRGVGTVRMACTVVPDAVTVANGHARISIYTAGGVHYCGSISTQPAFNQAYGYWEAGVRYKYQPGMAAAWWVQAPNVGSIIGNPQKSGVELDVFEHTSATTGVTGMDHAVHWDGYADGVEKSQNHPFTFVSLNDGNFHKFAVAWTPSSYTFYVDGVEQWTLTGAQAAISNTVEYAILSTEVQNAAYAPSGGYGPLGASTNAYIDVDYVHVYPYNPAITTTVLSPIADAYVQDGSLASTNFGTATTLGVKSDVAGSNKNAYLMFDLSSIKGTVQQATLYMTPVSVGEANITTAVNAVSSNTWTETGINWGNQPMSSALNSFGINYGANILTNFDVSGPATAGQIMSVAIVPSSPTGASTEVDYASRENSTTASRPILTVVSTNP